MLALRRDNNVQQHNLRCHSNVQVKMAQRNHQHVQPHIPELSLHGVFVLYFHGNGIFSVLRRHKSLQSLQQRCHRQETSNRKLALHLRCRCHAQRIPRRPTPGMFCPKSLLRQTKPCQAVGDAMMDTQPANGNDIDDTAGSASADSSSVDSLIIPEDERSPPMWRGANKKPHRNAGELMPIGISSLLRELSGLDENDIFLDIGAGVGNVVALVALATNVDKASGIEVRRNLYELGAKIMSSSANSDRLLERAQLICQDIVDMPFSRTPPCADATVVYWNNLLFDPRVIECVKEELSGMFLLRKLVSSLNFCPRPRDLCLNAFCRAFKLDKVLDLRCSWKADLQQVFLYKSC
ncbi:hypothetical protein V7S43_013817 [Phytophthora oleae]|uniref:Histone-lysine N-methyltransferase, H3 lysine-79 specific n=1 Tax=Phytophthora oleae TaxID=2107226 RepID=A0ABD3F6X6_9STRA